MQSVTQKTKSTLNTASLNSKNEMLAVKLKGGDVELVNENEIMYCKADGRNTIFFFEDGRVLVVSKILKRVFNSLREFGFHRIHNSYIINLDYVTSFVKKNSGGDIRLVNGEMLPVSQKQKRYVLSLFNIL